jgi:hypothetical protein
VELTRSSAGGTVTSRSIVLFARLTPIGPTPARPGEGMRGTIRRSARKKMGPEKEMGADVAASPHCPAAGVTKPGRRGSPLWAISRSDLSRGLWRRPPESFGSLRSFGFPRWLPVRAEALAVRRSADPKPRFRSPPSRASAEALAVNGRFPWPKPGLCLDSPGLASRVCRFAAPGPKPGPARWSPSRSPASTGGSAPTFVPLLPDRQQAEARFLPVWRGTRRPRTWALDDACHLNIR